MKVRNYLVMVLAVLVWFGSVVRGEAAEGRGYIGIRMDAAPLPELLVKHLRLGEGQGVRIQNVGVDTPADKAGLERDDIIVGFNGKDVTDNREFSEAVQTAGGGAEVSLDIIHLGERKKVTLKLTSFVKDSEFKAKFSPEPEVVQSWQPGRIFQLQPELDQWIQMEPGGGVGVIGGKLNRLFKEIYMFHYSTDGEEYSVTIEGNPNDDDAKVIVKIGDGEHATTVSKLHKLPKEYREAAEEAVKKARTTAAAKQHKRIINMPVLPNVPDAKIWKNLRQRRDFPGRVRVPDLEPRGDMFERIEKQMRQMQKRIKELEKDRGEKPHLEYDKSGEKESHEDETGDSAAHEEEKI